MKCLKSTIFWTVTPYSSEKALHGGTVAIQKTGVKFILGLLFYHEDGGDNFLRSARPSPKYTELQPRRPCCSQSPLLDPQYRHTNLFYLPNFLNLPVTCFTIGPGILLSSMLPNTVRLEEKANFVSIKTTGKGFLVIRNTKLYVECQSFPLKKSSIQSSLHLKKKCIAVLLYVQVFCKRLGRY